MVSDDLSAFPAEVVRLDLIIDVTSVTRLWSVNWSIVVTVELLLCCEWSENGWTVGCANSMIRLCLQHDHHCHLSSYKLYRLWQNASGPMWFMSVHMRALLQMSQSVNDACTSPIWFDLIYECNLKHKFRHMPFKRVACKLADAKNGQIVRPINYLGLAFRRFGKNC